LKEARVDRRLLQNRTGKRRVVIALRERGGRTLTRAFLREAEGVDFAKERIEPGAFVAADEVAHWDLLTSTFDTRRINHSEAYSRDGVHTNMAESDFSRLRPTGSARRLARGPSLRKQRSDRRPIHQQRAVLSSKPRLKKLLAGSGMRTSTGDHTHTPLRSSTMVTSPRRAACRRA
jgi:hypothetical protein